MPGEYRKSDVLCQDGEAQFDKSVKNSLIYIIGSKVLGSGFWVLGSGFRVQGSGSWVQGSTRPLAANVQSIQIGN